MLNLHVIQAQHGDCLLLEYGTSAEPRYILVDGGPGTVYRDHLKSVLKQVRQAGGALGHVVLSHVDDDHVKGLLDLMKELKRQQEKSKPLTIEVHALWHNSFGDTLGPEVDDGFARFLRTSGQLGEMPLSSAQGKSIAQGDTLSSLAVDLGVPINPGFDPSGIITLDQAGGPLSEENLKLWILGPSVTNLERLRQEWLDWLAEQEEKLSARDLLDEKGLGDVDASVPNLSSIILLASGDGKTVLLAGDGTGDDVLAGLQQMNLLQPGGTFHVDVLKLPHHGSQRNVTPEFFSRLTADKYVISANGKYGNPDPPTLEWLVTAARDQGRAVEIWITNPTESIGELLDKYPAGAYGYRLVQMEPGAHEMILNLTA